MRLPLIAAALVATGALAETSGNTLSSVASTPTPTPKVKDGKDKDGKDKDKDKKKKKDKDKDKKATPAPADPNATPAPHVLFERRGTFSDRSGATAAPQCITAF